MAIEQYPKNYLYRRIVQAKLFVDDNYSKKIDIDNISDEAFFSKFHFIRLFKRIYGKTPYQYLTSVRIDHAILLFQKNKSVSEVCFSVGFEDLSSFSELFKKNVGVSPSDFLKQERYKKQQITENPLIYVSGCLLTSLVG
ncbi:MAG: AraC family transcriptional regulator [Bacteroidota bacterium]|nr:AraC family transcriptional regulator [Bacteroidota bacterium]